MTTVWAPTGIAIASVLLFGPRLWPAVWIGAFVANAVTAAPLWTAAFIATGNTLEALIAFRLLRVRPHFDLGFQRVTEVLAFIGLAAFLSTTVSATVGVATLCVAGVQSWHQFAALWIDWWLGDALGALVFAPAIVLGVHDCGRLRQQWAKAALLIVGSIVIAYAVYGQLLGLSSHPLEYAVFPVVIAAAVSGGPAITSLVVVSVSVVTLWNTAQGVGPFGGAELHQSLELLQTFTGVLAATALLLAAAIAERETSEARERNAASVLRQRDDMLQLAMRGGSMGAWWRDLATNEVWWSGELEAIVGLDAGGFAGTEAGFFAFVHEDDRNHLRGVIDSAVASGSDYIVEFRFRHASGEWRWMEGRGRAVYGAGGLPQRIYGIGIDITERKRAEAALQDAKQAAESANQLKDQFLATLSHELRTPLNAILGYARMLQTDAIAPDKRQGALDVIERNAVAQNQLIEDLLDVSRITTGKVRLSPEPIGVATVLGDAIEGVKPAAEAKRLVFEVHLDPIAGMVIADRTRLQQVFWNLLTNAVKFTGGGGHVQVSARRDGAFVEVAVRDTGAGIPPDFLPFVFEPFRQADARLTRGHGGLGLGLAISKQLVELHGGTIRASSGGLGEGATFVIRLPRVTDAEASVASKAASPVDIPQIM